MRKTSIGIAALVLVAVAARCALAVTISGAVYTQNAVPAVTIRVWQLGDEMERRRERTFAPAAELTAPPGSFAIEAEVAVPWRIEVTARGHVAAAFDGALPEHATLPVLWLPAGDETPVHVELSGPPAPKLQLTGRILVYGAPWSGGPGWYPTIVRTLIDSKGDCRVVLPRRQGSLLLAAVASDGRWAWFHRSLEERGGIVVRVNPRRVAVTVKDKRGDPVAGAMVTTREAPHGAAALTDAAGTAVVQVPREESSMLLVSAPGLEGQGRVPTGGSTTVTVREAQVSRLVWTPPPATVLAKRTRGGEGPRQDTPLVLHAGAAALPTGSFELYAPGFAHEAVSVAEGNHAVAARFSPAATVEGRVVDEAGAGVAGVPVWAWERPAWSRSLQQRMPMPSLGPPLLPAAVSGGDGRFTIHDLLPGPQRLTALAPGMPRADSGPLTVAAGATIPVVLTLRPGTWLALAVRDPDQRPLRGAAVRAFALTRSSVPGALLPSAQRAAGAAASETTDAEGRVRLTALPAGDITLELALPGYVTKSLDVTLPSEGKDLGVVVMEPGVSVLGRVVDEEGVGVADAEVHAESLPGIAFGTPLARSDAQGHFEIADQPRSGTLKLRASGQNLVALGTVAVALPPVGPVELKVRHGRAVTGRVVDARDGEPVTGVRVSGSREVGRATFRWSMDFGHDETRDDGAFRIDGAEVGSCVVRASKAGFVDAKIDVEVPEEGPPPPVTIVLRRGLTLSGHVEDEYGSPLPAIDVTLQEASTRQDSAIATRGHGPASTDPDGRFTFEGLEPGRYVVGAEDESGAHASEFAEAGQKAEVVLRLRPPGTIVCRVRRQSGAAVDGAQVRLDGIGGDYRSVAPRATDATGAVSFDGLPAGRYRVTASVPGLAPDGKETAVEPGATAEVTITLEEGGVVIGRVLGLSADQLAKVTIGARGAGDRTPAPDGSFRREDVPLGPGTVTAYLRSEGRQRQASYDLTDPDSPATVELDFSRGSTLSGTVRRGGRAGSYLNVEAHPVDTLFVLAGQTAEDGSYAIKDLDPGTWEVEITDSSGRMLTGRRVLVDGDTRADFDVPSGEIRGRVLDARSREPIARASVRLRGERQPAVERTQQTDDAGAFHASELADGSYTVTASALGYEPAEAQATVSMGRAGEVTVALQPEQRLELVVHEPDGSSPGQVLLKPMRAGRTEDQVWVSCDASGRGVVTALGAGTYTMLVLGQGAALASVTVPSQDVPIQLAPSSRMRVVPPAAGGPWRVRTTSLSTGLVVPPFNSINPERGEWAMLQTSTLQLRVPAGDYLVQLQGPDSAILDKRVSATGEAEVYVRFDR